MAVRQGHSLPELILQLNVPQRTIMYRGIVRDIPAKLFERDLAPNLYPLWDTDKDKLITFTWYDNESYVCERRKFLKNFKTSEYYWQNYEMESYDSADGKQMYELLKDTFYLVDSFDRENFQQELATLYYETSQANWANIRLIRNFLLSDSDWSVANDSPLTEENKNMWVRYRRELRDLPLTNMQNDPNIKAQDIKFPIDPYLFKSMYSVDRPEAVYLDNPEQYIAISSYYIGTFRERMIQYLMVKEVTMDLYYKQFLEMLQTRPTEPTGYPDPVGKVFTSDEEYLDYVLENAKQALERQGKLEEDQQATSEILSSEQPITEEPIND
jgi:hypothetical protein